MVEPNSERLPMRTRPFAPSIDSDSQDLQQWWQRQPQQPEFDYAVDRADLEAPREDLLYQHFHSDPLFYNDLDMASQQQNEPVNYSVKRSSEQGPSQINPEGPSTNSGMRSDGAPRVRSSTFGMKSGESSKSATPVSASQQSTPTQVNRISNTQPPVPQAGPSYQRSASVGQAAPVSSVAHNQVLTMGSGTNTSRPSTSTRSPFTTPITSPPRSRPSQVLLINPTSTTALTGLMLSTLRPILPNTLEVTAYNAPYPAPTAIESMVDSVLSSETVLRDLAKYSTNNGETIQNFDALLVANFSKHPLIDALRESYDVPVIGILEASLYTARMLGTRFGIITTSTRMKLQIDDAVASYGLSHFAVGIESLHVNPHDLLSISTTSPVTSPDGSSQYSASSAMSRPKEELHKRLVVHSRSLVSRGADTIILGSEFLASIEANRLIKDAVRDDDGRRTVNVIVAVEAGITMLNGLVAMGLPTSKKGIFKTERDARRARGQTWL